MAQYYDIDTGEPLEKPLVTVFTIARDLGTPTLQQLVQNDGYYALNWSEVEGADYYEVYEYDPGMEYASLQYTTENTFCDYNDMKSVRDSEEAWEETYEDTEIDVAEQWLMNTWVLPIYSYFVVAKTDGNEVSGMSNLCAVGDIAGQLPYMLSDDFQTEYYGDSALALPAYADVEMVDETTGKFLIDYHGAKVTLLDDGSMVIEAKFKNLPISMMQITFSGMEYEAFLEDAKRLTEREDQLATQALTTEKNIDIPYTPDSEPESESGLEPESGEDPEKELKPEPVKDPDTEFDPELKEDPEPKIDTEAGLLDTVFANSALSEWIALNMLNHETTISLDGFNEASDSEYLIDALLEAYTQNPLIGIMDSASYDYDTNSLEILYIMSAEDTEAMQKASLAKAAEIADEIIKPEMSDYEKEEAINEYLCKNASYNEEIMEYINEDGTISEEAVDEFSASFTPYGVLVDNYGVCESYAEAFLLIAREAGLEAVIVTGRLDNVNHEWNRVKMDGSWYSLDVTNNDNEYMPNCYFNLPDEIASGILVQDDTAFIDSYVDQYTSEGIDFEYYNVKKLYTEDADEAASMMTDLLKNGNSAVIRMDLNYGNTDIAEIIQNAVNRSETEEVMYYYNAGVIAVIKK
jgi:transglutaminase-like putative cysteine protease